MWHKIGEVLKQSYDPVSPNKRDDDYGGGYASLNSLELTSK